MNTLIVTLLLVLFLVSLRSGTSDRSGTRARREARKARARDLKIERVLRCWSRFSLPR
jgi:hypothetical protein